MTDLKIIGAGIGGVAAAWYAQQAGVSCQIFEATSSVGGNAVTVPHGDNFLYDSGAHRFHDKNSEITADFLNLMGDELHLVNAPSQIFFQGGGVDFPLSPLNLFSALGSKKFILAALDLLKSRLKNSRPRPDSFADFAVCNYGQVIADLFLLNYSEKLWGLPCHQLSPVISGKRLEGLTLKTFLVEAIWGARAKTKHLDGAFYYPTGGIGKIVTKMMEALSPESVKLNCPVNVFHHNGKRITSITVKGSRQIVDQLLYTASLASFFSSLDPAPPDDLMRLVKSLRTRNVILVAIFLDKAQVSNNASIYFPEDQYPFTRIYEPINRCQTMAPPGKTSIIAEIPCGYDPESLWYVADDELFAPVVDALSACGFFEKGEIIDVAVYRMADAYSVLEKGYEQQLAELNSYLQSFENLHLSGRNGTFSYIHIHDLMLLGKRLASQLAKGA